jgi:hypothetical protein
MSFSVLSYVNRILNNRQGNKMIIGRSTEYSGLHGKSMRSTHGIIATRKPRPENETHVSKHIDSNSKPCLL